MSDATCYAKRGDGSRDMRGSDADGGLVTDCAFTGVSRVRLGSLGDRLLTRVRQV